MEHHPPLGRDGRRELHRLEKGGQAAEASIAEQGELPDAEAVGAGGRAEAKLAGAAAEGVDGNPREGGAPMRGDVAAWADRIAKGPEALYDSGVNGLAGTGMIAKGGCMSCSDEEVNAAVDYMVAGSQ